MIIKEQFSYHKNFIKHKIIFYINIKKRKRKIEKRGKQKTKPLHKNRHDCLQEK